MSKLISGKEALIALANEEVVEIWFNLTDGWHEIKTKDAYSFDLFLDQKQIKFRLKPRTIKIGEFEVPAPFEPKEDCRVYIIDDRNGNGYRVFSYELSAHSACTFIGMWRTEEEIIQVVTALRSVLNGK